ncbi:MAG: GNAT family N-acetyltransferase [Deltaproteobacteria bacterium]|nr:GNAT family N-acetyltransferase [Deltaproteobacteria bacterium]
MTTPPGSIRIVPEPLTSAVAQGLIATLNAELSARYPEEGATHFRLDEDELAPGRGVFVVIYRGDDPIGCGAVRRTGDTVGELKRMFVAPPERGHGVGQQLLAALESEARRLGVQRLVLETGTRQHAAIALYERAGFERVPAFGEYVGSPLSVCMAKVL